MAPDPARPTRLAPLATLFFVSGAAALVDQIVWLRHLGLIFGNTTLAAATLLAVFLGGLGLGAALVAPRATRVRRPLLLYGVLEVLVALWALASPRLFDGIDSLYVLLYRELGTDPAIFTLARTLLAFLALGPPTLLMGASLPVLVAAAERRRGPAERERAAAILYGWNTLGAVSGVAFAGFVGLPAVGVRATLALASAAQGLVALAAVLLAGKQRPDSSLTDLVPAARPGPGGAAGRPAASARLGGFLPAAAVLMGATGIAYEVLWTRILVFYFGSNVYAFSLMLVVYLFGLGTGAAVIARWLPRLEPARLLLFLEAALALLAVASVALLIGLDRRLVALSELLHPRSFAEVILGQLVGVLPILLPPTLLFGASFPALVALAHRRGTPIEVATGRLYGWNTAGAVLGSLGAGFLLVPAVGSQNGLLLLGSLNGLLALGFAWLALPDSRGKRLLAAASCAIPILALPFFPAHRVILNASLFRSSTDADLLHFDEDPQAAVAVRRVAHPAGPYISLELNGVNVAGTSHDLYAVQLLQGHLPLLLADRQARKVLHIGFGSGGTAHAVSQHPVEEIRIVEISPAVLAASNRFFRQIHHGVLEDPRVRVEINDGRNFLLASPERFDAILSDSIHPRYAGNGALYSRDYFELLSRRLEPGGIASMWLPMYSLSTANYLQILRAFQDLFPWTVVWYEPSALNSFTIVTGKREGPLLEPARIAFALEEPGLARALEPLGIRSPGDLALAYLVGPRELGPLLEPVPPHVDDQPTVEYESGRLLDRDRPWFETFSLLLNRRPPAPPPELLETLPPGDRADLEARWAERRRELEFHRSLLARRYGAVRTPAGGD